LSERTLRRYLATYRQEGFGGLKPKGKGKQPTAPAIAPDIVDQAILLRREVPSRSVAQIIQIMEWEGRIGPGQIKRSTLQEKLTERGYSTRHMRMYAESGVAARRFQQKHRKLAVNIAESDIAIESFVGRHGLTFPVLKDKDQAVYEVYDITPIPTSFLIDKHGTVLKVITGAMTERDIASYMNLLML